METFFEDFKNVFDLMKTSEVTLPVLDVVGLVFFLSICIVARSPRSGLVVSFLFSCKFAWPFVVQFGTGWSVTYVTFALVAATFSIMEAFIGKKE